MPSDIASPPLTAVNLLLVDDEPRNLDVLESILERPDYNLLRANSAESALRLLLDGDFAAIVLDIQMPEMNGIELAQLIKQRRRTREIPIIFLTAYYQDDTHILEGYDTGAVDYLTKPLDPRILKSKIAVFVELYRKNHALARAKAELEVRVQERTAELTRANDDLRRHRDALAQSEARVQIELAEQRRIEAELRSRENQLRLVTDHASVYIAHCDRDHRIKYVNRPYAERFGLDPSAIIGRTVPEVLGEPAYALLRPWLDAALGGRRVQFEVELPYPGRTPRWVYAVHEPERSPDGEVVGLVAVVTDITDRKNAELQIADARDKALAASRAKDQFLARLSHELRTPLNPTLLLASHRAGDARLGDRVREDFRTIADNIALEARLIDDLLDLTRISAGKLDVQRHPVSLNTLVRDSLALANDAIAAKRIGVSIDLAASHDLALGDDVRLKQIFLNIINNAVKFTPDEGRITLHSTLAADSGRWRLEVVDTGIGMTAAELGRIFQPFTQGDHASDGVSRKFGGLGLGLSICHSLIELHHGTITAASEGPDRGTRIVVELPLEARRPPNHAHPQSRPANRQPAPRPTGSGRLLLVEDHAATRLAMTRLLERQGYEVVAAGTVAEAKQALNRGPFQLLISDIGLPDGKGHEIMEAIDDDEVMGIALTGYGMEEDLARTREAGFFAHLTKPVSVEALDRAMESVAAARQARRTLSPDPATRSRP